MFTVFGEGPIQGTLTSLIKTLTFNISLITVAEALLEYDQVVIFREISLTSLVSSGHQH